MTFTASTIAFKDGNGTAQLNTSYTDGTNQVPSHVLLDNTGAIVPPATSALQTSGNTSLASIATNTAGAATSALQTTGNTSLATIATAVQAATPAGTNLIGSVAPPGTVHLTAAPTVTAGAYTAGQVVGGKISLATAARVNNGSGVIQNVLVTVSTALSAPFDVFFFDTNPTNSTFTDNAALALNAADLPYLCGVAHCNDQVSGGTPQIFQAVNLAIPFKLGAAATTLYAVIVMRGGETLASTSAIGLSVIILQD